MLNSAQYQYFGFVVRRQIFTQDELATIDHEFKAGLNSAYADTGALRVIPGSHRNPLHADIQDKIKELGLPIRDLPCHVCQSEPGMRWRADNCVQATASNPEGSTKRAAWLEKLRHWGFMEEAA